MLRKIVHRVMKTASYQIGNFSDINVPGFVLNPAIKIFSFGVGINIDEVAVPENGFDTFGDFFARQLKSGVRSICKDIDCIASPCDGRLVATHTLADDNKTGLIVKGYNYNLKKLLGGSVDDKFAGGRGYVIYLHPRDYHRVHLPVDASLFEVRHIAGTRFPVAPWSESRVSGLYEKNERMVFNFKVTGGYLSLIMVAAFGVGNITTPYGPGDGNHITSVRVLKNAVQLTKGDELGAFRLGSTVVMLWSKDLVTDLPDREQPVLLGQRIGTILPVNKHARGEKV